MQQFNDYPKPNLKQFVLLKALFQSQLAKMENVSIRNIQMYEQREHSINKAQFEIFLKLSKALCCSILDLYEY